MDINLSELRRREGEFVHFEEEIELDQINFHQNELPVGEHVRVSGGAIITSDESINVSLDFSADVVQHCRRCLAPIEEHLERHEELEFRLDINAEIDSDGDLSIFRYKKTDKNIDLVPYLKRFIKLNLEPYPLCKPDCRGLCPHCGANLNLEEDHQCQEEEEEKGAKDPRMDKLGELL
ncbi:MAG: YceD family protein [Candidatus Bipolaricaulota bacterium]